MFTYVVRWKVNGQWTWTTRPSRRLADALASVKGGIVVPVSVTAR